MHTVVQALELGDKKNNRNAKGFSELRRFLQFINSMIQSETFNQAFDYFLMQVSNLCAADVKKNPLIVN